MGFDRDRTEMEGLEQTQRMRPKGKPDHYETRRRTAIERYQEGCTQARIAVELGVTERSVRRWQRDYQRAGQDGLRSKPNRGRPPKLNPSQMEVLRQTIEGRKRLRIAEIRRLILTRFDVLFSYWQTRRLARALGWKYRESEAEN